MNLPNKLTIIRIIFTIMLVFILLFPFHLVGIDLIKWEITRKDQTIIINIKYIVAGLLFLIASLTDYVDGYLARKLNLVTDTGKVLDAVADKILVNSVLIILAGQGIIGPIIPVLIIGRDTVVDILKMLAGREVGAVAASSMGKWKTAIMMVALTLILFNNLPFELYNLRVSMFLLTIATGLSLASGVEYYYGLKKVIFKKL